MKAIVLIPGKGAEGIKIGNNREVEKVWWKHIILSNHTEYYIKEYEKRDQNTRTAGYYYINNRNNILILWIFRELVFDDVFKDYTIDLTIDDVKESLGEIEFHILKGLKHLTLENTVEQIYVFIHKDKWFLGERGKFKYLTYSTASGFEETLEFVREIIEYFKFKGKEIDWEKFFERIDRLFLKEVYLKEVYMLLPFLIDLEGIVACKALKRDNLKEYISKIVERWDEIFKNFDSKDKKMLEKIKGDLNSRDLSITELEEYKKELLEKLAAFFKK